MSSLSSSSSPNPMSHLTARQKKLGLEYNKLLIFEAKDLKKMLDEASIRYKRTDPKDTLIRLVLLNPIKITILNRAEIELEKRRIPIICAHNNKSAICTQMSLRTNGFCAFHDPTETKLMVNVCQMDNCVNEPMDELPCCFDHIKELCDAAVQICALTKHISAHTKKRKSIH